MASTMKTDKPFAEWIGRTSVSEDAVTERLNESYKAIFDTYLAPVPDGVAPLGIHWCLSPAIATMSQLGEDGHPAKNMSLPPVPLPRRMWAGGELEILDPLQIGDKVRRTSTIQDVVRKDGRTGDLWFVTLGHVYETERGPAVRERQDLVYREAAKPGAKVAIPSAAPESEPAAASRTIETSPTLLFRYSALTFNGHRIHYDLPYATGVEGYDGLVVHGPIQATLLLNLAATSESASLGRFSYRGLSPAIAGNRLAICRGSGEKSNQYWTESGEGVRHMQASTS
ncbi:protein dehydratase [Mesorhizobium denitrificans]|uniref:Protein dehydratase n=2 Tax=Mesorhizobium denitrificans TaxID=2294114 RepID=A0A371XBV0_9HYPH|nr:protein dehydratase [Mesorhizobium denitrificans]